jgi:integrase
VDVGQLGGSSKGSGKRKGETVMAVYKRGGVWWYKFRFANQIIRESAKTESKTVARDAEWKRRRELEEGFNNLTDNRTERIKTISRIADEYLEDYKLKHRSHAFAKYALGHVTRLLGQRMVVDISDDIAKQYQMVRLKEGAAPKTINEEVGFLLRMLADRGDAIRTKLRREKSLKLKVATGVGRAFSPEQKQALLRAAKASLASKGTHSQKGTRSPNLFPALMLALNSGMRDAEIRNLTWDQIDFEKRILTVGKSKSEAGVGRTIPLNASLLSALVDHAKWYTGIFGTAKPEWYLFPGRVGKPKKGQSRPLDPTKPITSLKKAWQNARKRAGVSGRWHDARHTLITELAETGAGDQTIMDIAGHVSRQMLARYSHIRMEAKRRALDAVGTEIQPAAANAEERVEEAGQGTIQ